MFGCEILKNSKVCRRSCSFRECVPPIKFTCLTNHPWGCSVLSITDFMDVYYSSAIRFTIVKYWSVTSDILLNSKITNSPRFFFRDILIDIPSGLLHHILYSGIVGLYCAQVKDYWEFHFQLWPDRSKVFSPFIQMNLKWVDSRRDNSPWKRSQHRWCVIVGFEKRHKTLWIHHRHISLSHLHRLTVTSEVTRWCPPSRHEGCEYNT